MNDRCELLIRNGLLFDGINPGRRLDVAISDGRIVAIARHLRMEAEREIDAAGMWVTPGFIDIHTHYDLEVEIAPALSESVRHGVTTVVIGGCSLSTTYGAPEDLADIFSRVETLPKDLIEPWLRKAEPRRKAREYFDHLAELKLGPNVAAMLGHSTLRVAVMGLERSLRDHATPQELREMRKLAEQALEAGCIGISVDMVHWHKVNGAFAGRALPSHHAALEEYEMLAQVCRNRDAVFQVTPNPENPRTVLDIIGLSTGIWRAPLRNTILSALDMDRMPHLWRFYGPLLFVCNQLLGCNIKLQTLPEPFVIYADGHITPFFEEFSAGVKLNNCKDREARRLMWRDPAFRQEFFDNWKSGRATFHRDLNGMYIVSCPDDKLVGRSIAAVARQAGVDPLEYFATLLERYDELLRWKACSANARDTIRHKLLRHRHILPGFSDAGAHSRNLAFFDSALTVLRQAVQFNVMPIERAIRRITSEPAAWFNLQAGVLAPGSRADINVIDPERLRQPVPAPKCVKDEVLQGAARMVKRDRIPAVRHVFIKGVEVVRHGMPLEALGAKRLGEVLTQLNPTRSPEEALRRHRNRISEFSSSFEPKNYWTVFLLKHQHPANIALHCLAFLLMYAVAATALYSGNLWWLLAMPLSQAVGLVGHWLFERSPIDQRDTVFSMRAVASLHRMFFAVVTGRYRAELNRAKLEYSNATRGSQSCSIVRS